MMDKLEVGVSTNKFEMLAFREDATAGALEDLFERDTTVDCRTTGGES